MPNKLNDTLEHKRKRSEQGEVENSPHRAPEDPDKSSGDTAAPDDAYSNTKRSRDVRNERADKTHAPR